MFVHDKGGNTEVVRMSVRQVVNVYKWLKRVNVMECDLSDQSGSKRGMCEMQLGPSQHHVILQRGCISEKRRQLAEEHPCDCKVPQAQLSLAPMDHVLPGACRAATPITKDGCHSLRCGCTAFSPPCSKAEACRITISLG